MMILNSQEIHALTGYARPCKQIEALKTMGVGFKEYDGRPIVLQEHVKSWIEGKPVVFGGLRLENVK